MLTLTLRHAAAAALIAGLSFAGAASAQTRTWNFGDQTGPGGSCGPIGTATYGNIVDCTQQPSGTVVDLRVSAYSSDGTSSAYRTAALNYNGTGSGVGAYNQTEGLSATQPNHAMDNSTPGVDMMLLSFTSAQVLKNVTLGWSGADGDFQVLAYTGSTTFSTASITGKTAGQLIAAGNGWNLVTTVDGAANITTPDMTYGVNAGNVSSSYWLISAYNSAFGVTTGITSGIDAIKVLAVNSIVPTPPGGSVSAPGTLALAGLGLAFMMRSRRRS